MNRAAQELVYLSTMVPGACIGPGRPSLAGANGIEAGLLCLAREQWHHFGPSTPAVGTPARSQSDRLTGEFSDIIGDLSGLLSACRVAAKST